MALIRRRDQHGSEKKDDPARTDTDDNGDDRKPMHTTTTALTAILRPILWALFAVLSMITLGFLLSLFLSKLRSFLIASMLPVVACFWRAVRLDGRSMEQRLLPLTVVSTTVFALLPSFLGSGFAAVCIVAFSLATVPSSAKPSFFLAAGSSTKHQSSDKGSPLPVLYSTLLLVTILLIENFMVWVVSATFEAGQTAATAPPPLQDNGQVMMRMATEGLTKKDVVGLRRLWNVQGALVACLGTSFVLAEVFRKRNLYALGCRAVLTLAMARTIRTVSFLVTVLPSQNKFCYRQHFPYPLPTDWLEWFWVGLLPSKYGGCNDLIISGHATVTSTLACVASSVSDDVVFCIALWTMVVLDYMVEIYEGFHYSVDMWLGMVLVSLLWRVLQPVEGASQSASHSQQPESFETIDVKSNEWLLWKGTVAAYTAVALVPFLQMTILPSWTVNFLIVLYTLCVVGLYLGFARQTQDSTKAALYQHAAQHFLYCLLFMALGVYL
mmetsp:Transcript_35092/g.73085  ORF Transcript_35092/g.73085 Transcript_35092/m.73085 type:complete len:496 (-) Transcript_35092:535-2022(-)